MPVVGSLRFGLAATAIAVLLGIPHTGQATPQTAANGSFTFGGSLTGFVNSDGSNFIGGSPNKTTQVTLRTTAIVNPGTEQGNISPPISDSDQVTLSNTTLPVPSPNVFLTLQTPLIVAVDGFQFSFVTEEFLASGPGTLGIALTGRMIAAPAGFYQTSTADLSIAFTQTAPGKGVGATYSLDTPAVFNIPEPATLSVLASGLLGAGLLRRRRAR